MNTHREFSPKASQNMGVHCTMTYIFNFVKCIYNDIILGGHFKCGMDNETLHVSCLQDSEIELPNVQLWNGRESYLRFSMCFKDELKQLVYNKPNSTKNFLTWGIYNKNKNWCISLWHLHIPMGHRQIPSWHLHIPLLHLHIPLWHFQRDDLDWWYLLILQSYMLLWVTCRVTWTGRVWHFVWTRKESHITIRSSSHTHMTTCDSYSNNSVVTPIQTWPGLLKLLIAKSQGYPQNSGMAYRNNVLE